MRFIHSILAVNQAIAADGEQNYDLPVNPLSVILLHLSPLNETSTIANYAAMAGLLTGLDNIRMTYRGTSVLDLTGEDLVAFLTLATRFDIRQSNMVETDDDRRSLVIPIPLSRKPYDQQECFPEVKRGESVLTCTWDIAATPFDGLRISIETIELPDATPTHFQRITTIAQTFAATGPNHVDLPIGNVIRGILCFGTTGFAGATPAPTLGELRLLLDNIEYGYSATDFEVSRAIAALTKGRLGAYSDHFHGVDASGGAQEDTQQQQHGISKFDNYTYLDYDPTEDDAYSIVTGGAGRVHLRVDAETADAARFLPIEKMEIAEFIRG